MDQSEDLPDSLADRASQLPELDIFRFEDARLTGSYGQLFKSIQLTPSDDVDFFAEVSSNKSKDRLSWKNSQDDGS